MLVSFRGYAAKKHPSVSELYTKVSIYTHTYTYVHTRINIHMYGEFACICSFHVFSITAYIHTCMHTYMRKDCSHTRLFWFRSYLCVSVYRSTLILACILVSLFPLACIRTCAHTYAHALNTCMNLHTAFMVVSDHEVPVPNYIHT